MGKLPATLSVIVNNYNYQGFVAFAIESALSQDPQPEVIIVDDCSTDNSRDVISKYSDRATLVLLEENQGQGGALSIASESATGDLVLFLDADDFMLPGAAKTIIENHDPDVAIHHYRMRYADEVGELSGIYPPPEMPLAEGDLSEQLRTIGTYDGTVTSGMVFARWALQKVLPMENPDGFRYGGDGYFTASVPLYGPNASHSEAITAYRLHGRQHSQFAKAYAKRARWRIDHAEQRYATTISHAHRLGLDVAEDLGADDTGQYFERLVSLVFEAESHPVAGDTLRALIRENKARHLAEQSGARQLLDTIWWLVFGVLPDGPKQSLLAWRIDAAARPAWLQSIGRFIRRRG